MMRPASIVNFERFYLAAIAIGIVNTFLSWDESLAMVQTQSQPGMQFGPGFVWAATAFGVIINLLLWYFIARRASVVAKWIFLVLLAIGVVSLLINISSGAMLGTINTGLGILAVMLELLAAWKLFRPDARSWFAGSRGEPTADTFS